MRIIFVEQASNLFPAKKFSHRDHRDIQRTQRKNTLCSLWETYTKKIVGEDRMFKFILTEMIELNLTFSI